MQDFHDVECVADIRNLIDQLLTDSGVGAFWLHRDGNAELALFLNGAHAALYRDTDGAWSNSPSQPDDQFEQFILENGQIDEFPLSQCVPTQLGINAFLDTVNNGTLSPRIEWL